MNTAEQIAEKKGLIEEAKTILTDFEAALGDATGLEKIMTIFIIRDLKKDISNLTSEISFLERHSPTTNPQPARGKAR